ncbi:MAG: cupin domain-containing protein [Acidobacteria bacterium]|nr:cupin domain-containing protein [Acidobacteriota bacterium]
MLIRISLLALVMAGGGLAAEDRKVDATFLRKNLADVKPQQSDVTTATCRYKPVFGAGDADARLLRGVARFGEMIVDAGGASAPVGYPAEEQVYYVLDGTGTVSHNDQQAPVKKNDFMYFAPGVKHGAAGGPLRVLVMGFKIPPGTQVKVPEKLPIANIDEVKKQVVGNHPPTTLYQLLIGDTTSTRDRLAVAHILTSLFIMEFDAGGTNFPHHHEREEEIYIVLDGHGDMVAGGGMDGIEGRFPAKPGDAYFFRLNTTVGFYAANKPGEPKSHILALRSLFPFGRMR